MGYNNQQQIFSLQLTYPPANCEGLHQFAIKYGSFKNDDFQGKVMDFHSYVSWLTDCKCASSLPLKWSFGGVHHLNHLRVSWNGGAPKASILMFFFFQIIINQPFWDPKMTPHLWKPPFSDTSVLDLLGQFRDPKPLQLQQVVNYLRIIKQCSPTIILIHE